MDNPLATLGTQDKKIKIKRKHNSICVGHPYAQGKTNKVNTWGLLQTTGGNNEPTMLNAEAV